MISRPHSRRYQMSMLVRVSGLTVGRFGAVSSRIVGSILLELVRELGDMVVLRFHYVINGLIPGHRAIITFSRSFTSVYFLTWLRT